MKRKSLLLENKVDLGYKSFKFLIFLNNNTCRGSSHLPSYQPLLRGLGLPSALEAPRLPILDTVPMLSL